MYPFPFFFTVGVIESTSFRLDVFFYFLLPFYTSPFPLPFWDDASSGLSVVATGLIPLGTQPIDSVSIS